MHRSAIASHVTMKTVIPFTVICLKSKLSDHFGRVSSIKKYNATVFATNHVETWRTEKHMLTGHSLISSMKHS